MDNFLNYLFERVISLYMNAKIQNDLNLIKESVLKTVSAEAIYLFGSHAYGTPAEESDLDIYVVVPDDVGDLSDLYGNILTQLWSKKMIHFDLLIGHSSVFNRRKTGPTLERTIAQKGMILHGT